MTPNEKEVVGLFVMTYFNYVIKKNSIDKTVIPTYRPQQYLFLFLVLQIRLNGKVMNVFNVQDIMFWLSFVDLVLEQVFPRTFIESR